MEHLECDGALVVETAREIDRRHAAPAEHTFDLVAIHQGGLNTCQVISQDGQFRLGSSKMAAPGVIG